MICGAVKAIAGNPDPLVCNLDAGHEPPHAVREAGAATPFVWWGDGVAWTSADDAEREQRRTWRKGHVRRGYQTLAMWKAGR